MPMTANRDALGDRMKSYEIVETGRALDGKLPVYARIDGRSFSRFTKGMNRPFDERMIAAMVDTTKLLVHDTHARIGYTQSDEISLIWLYDGEASEPMFAGKVQKMASVLAALATTAFMTQIMAKFDDWLGLMRSNPHFDCRVFNLPDKTEASNAILWRALDAKKNAVSMAARANFSHKAIFGKDQTAMRTMLAEKGVAFDSYPTAFKWGTFVRRVNFDRAFTADELARIPAAHRPSADATVIRTEVREIDMPEFVTVKNREDVIFSGVDAVV